MMTKKKMKWKSGIKVTFLVPVIAGIVFIFACTENPVTNLDENAADEANKEELFYVVETMPAFNDEGVEGFKSFIAENLVYPEKAIEEGIEGKVFVQFIVGSNGKVKDAKIVRGVHPLLDAEALRVVNASPEWEPGIQRGEKVNVQFTFPISYSLN